MLELYKNSLFISMAVRQSYGVRVMGYGLRVIWLFAKNWTLIIKPTIK